MKLVNDRKGPKIHAKGVELVGPGKGFSVCGIYRLDLADDLNLVTCKNCLRKLARARLVP